MRGIAGSAARPLRDTSEETSAIAPRLKSEIEASALRRRAQGGGAFATVLRRGDDSAGALYVVVRTLDGDARLFSPIRDMSGARAWMATPALPEREIDARCAKLFDRDPDIWVVEVEDREGRHFLIEPVEWPDEGPGD